MNRRDFARLAGTALSAGAFSESLVEAQVAARPAAPRAATRARMKVGTQHGDSDEILRVLAGFGVNHICSRLPAPAMDAAWSVDSLSRLRERVESFGITLDMVPLPMSSIEISRSESPAIMLGTEPDREQQIDDICQMIRNSVARRHSVAQVQPDVPRRSPNRADARPRRRPLQHLRLRRRQAGSAADRRPAGSTPTSTGSASPISSSASCRSPPSTRSGSRVTRRIPACRKARAGAASRPCSDRSTA